MARLPSPVPADPAADPERLLALSYAPRDRRAGLEALLALDATLAAILRSARDPLIAQMRLTWWHAALSALDTAPPPAEPVLRGLAAQVLPHGVTGGRLAAMIDGWEALLDDPLDPAGLDRHAEARGAGLFAVAGVVVGASAGDPLDAAGRGWALVDLSRHLGDIAAATQAASAAAAPLARACSPRWSRSARPLGALAQLARMTSTLPLDVPVPLGSPRRVARIAFHRLTGR